MIPTSLHKMRHYDFSNMRSVNLSPDRLASYDCVLIATDHSSYDYEVIARDAKLVVDTRNATRQVKHNRERSSTASSLAHFRRISVAVY